MKGSFLVRILCLAMVFVCVLCFVSCDRGDAPENRPTAAATLKTGSTAEPTKAPTAEPTKAPTAEPTKAPTAEPTKAPTATPTMTPSAKVYSSLDFSSTSEAQKVFVLGNNKVIGGVLVSGTDAPALQGTTVYKTFTLLADITIKAVEGDNGQYFGLWTSGKYPDFAKLSLYTKENKVKFLDKNGSVLKETDFIFAIDTTYRVAFQIKSDGTAIIAINGKTVLQATDKAKYYSEEVLIFWNQGNSLEIDNLVIADENYVIG